MMHTVYIALGSNLGDREAALLSAVLQMESRGLGTVTDHSEWIETKPVGPIQQPDFLNGVACLQTSLDPHDLLQALKSLEIELGRTPGERWGPREIDLDILLYDNVVLQTDTLTLPHPHMQEREFVLRPLNELAPNLTHPVLHKTVSELFQSLSSAAPADKVQSR